jgi:hypothetical protein
VRDVDKPSNANNIDNHSQFLSIYSIPMFFLTKRLNGIQMNYKRVSNEITGIQTNVKAAQNRIHRNKVEQGLERKSAKVGEAISKSFQCTSITWKTAKVLAIVA